MSRGLRRQLLGLLATIAAAACSPSPDADVSTGASPTPAAAAPAAPAQAPSLPGAPPAAAPARAPVTEATHATAPLRARVVSVRQETPDTIRVELALTNLASTDAAPPGSSAASSVEAAVKALDGASVLAADGRRRMFPLRGPDGGRVGPPADAPPPGGERTFWALFSGRQGPVSVVLPGFSPLTGLAVAEP
jgi:hypothetical protein